MYSDKENVNILTSLLVAHGVRHAVVCPGSRNAPIVHNLCECPDIDCIAVTDERSAGFYALGIAQYTGEQVAVCVTSGSALLNVSPAVVEAFYQHLPLIVISADRPKEWIGQLDGQTMPQPDALGKFVIVSVDLPEPHNDSERWHCNRLVNEALLSSIHHSPAPVHINVPISEPLFNFTREELPLERMISYVSTVSTPIPYYIIEAIQKAQRPLFVFGQGQENDFDKEDLKEISNRFIIFKEPLSSGQSTIVHFDEAMTLVKDKEDYLPDFIIYFGDTIVSKRTRHFLRKATDAETCMINRDGVICDPLMNARYIIETESPKELVKEIAESIKVCSPQQKDYYDKWHTLLAKAEDHCNEFAPGYSQMKAVKLFEEILKKTQEPYSVCYSNSSAVRLANIYSNHFCHVNRGVNGIEGSLSAAAGMSVVAEENVFCIIGDLSFFYDQNALWNTNLKGNLRILLLNNSCGGIFHQLKGLENSNSRNTYVSAEHHTDAKGTCIANDISYRDFHKCNDSLDGNGMKEAMEWLIDSKSERPMLLEIHTDADEDANVLKQYFTQISD